MHNTGSNSTVTHTLKWQLPLWEPKHKVLHRQGLNWVGCSQVWDMVPEIWGQASPNWNPVGLHVRPNGDPPFFWDLNFGNSTHQSPKLYIWLRWSRISNVVTSCGLFFISKGDAYIILWHACFAKCLAYCCKLWHEQYMSRTVFLETYF